MDAYYVTYSGMMVGIALSAGLHYTLFEMFSKTRCNQDNKDLQTQQAYCMMSLFHAAVVTVLSFYIQFMEFSNLDLYAFFNQLESPAFAYTSCFLIGYMVYDLKNVLLSKKTRNMLYFYHHIVSILGVSIGLSGRFQPPILMSYLGELPIVFVNIRLLANFANRPKLSEWMTPFIYVTWTVFRLGFIPFLLVMIYFYRQVYTIHEPVYFWALSYVFLSLATMNLYWTYKMLSGTLKATNDISEKPSDHCD
ncbi:uncharacterized protein LOC142344032 isoform X1 [Convolutriloba macropyga]|uniref:uncharacterized protein LOC142344032 isoform X1 n=1 Tax=Convolutriloba macropyga TaxID=536237 RepID=UPI003F5275C9